MSMKHILITGASSGIGQALALEYAAPGVCLSLSARNKARLHEVAQKCRDKGAEVDEQIIDVMDRGAMTQWLITRDEHREIDLIIANAGISGGSSGVENWEESTRDIFAVNLAGTLNTILPIIPLMINRGRGQVALMSSLAGFRGLASSPAYSASKVAVKAYGEALRMRYQHNGLKVNVICPGFVKSRITAQNTFKMPLLMEGPKAARIIKNGLLKNKAVIAFPWPMALAARLFALMPLAIVERITKIMPSKE
ncbi:putative short-chain dehydrogenase/reductase [Candidatus Terasakiella magnetica]|uniref:Putative short-chain dehydrogenase/reductase n=1 Tax=Candidatus Terasakiella magnetica TaxID=1867952 RepID=A0A1C3RK08_9PROT|nr:SDR family NAD(P)-dependent oxidoreductase [Candidatus Terasakiella magnetica]SCA57563.1 putative short-chain dehydrogenase/reductase [Candidatus Terasakiella magnetica]